MTAKACPGGADLVHADPGYLRYFEWCCWTRTGRRLDFSNEVSRFRVGGHSQYAIGSHGGSAGKVILPTAAALLGGLEHAPRLG